METPRLFLTDLNDLNFGVYSKVRNKRVLNTTTQIHTTMFTLFSYLTQNSWKSLKLVTNESYVLLLLRLKAEEVNYTSSPCVYVIGETICLCSCTSAMTE